MKTKCLKLSGCMAIMPSLVAGTMTAQRCCSPPSLSDVFIMCRTRLVKYRLRNVAIRARSAIQKESTRGKVRISSTCNRRN
jgi:hypothetical protein